MKSWSSLEVLIHNLLEVTFAPSDKIKQIIGVLWVSSHLDHLIQYVLFSRCELRSNSSVLLDWIVDIVFNYVVDVIIFVLLQAL